MRPEDRTLLLVQLDQHSSYLVEAARLRVRMRRAQKIIYPLSMASTSAIPMLIITLCFLPFFPLAAIIMGGLTLLFLGAILMALRALNRPEQNLRRLKFAHEGYMESVLGRGNYLQLQRHGKSSTYSAQVREKESGKLVLDLGVTEDLPMEEYIRG